MVFDWDETKAAANRAKHGVPFERVVGFRFDTALIQVDGRRQYGEIREVAFGLIEGILHQVVFTRRLDEMRVISLRRASRRERIQYNLWVDECEGRHD